MNPFKRATGVDGLENKSHKRIDNLHISSLVENSIHL